MLAIGIVLANIAFASIATGLPLVARLGRCRRSRSPRSSAPARASRARSRSSSTPSSAAPTARAPAAPTASSPWPACSARSRSPASRASRSTRRSTQLERPARRRHGARRRGRDRRRRLCLRPPRRRALPDVAGHARADRASRTSPGSRSRAPRSPPTLAAEALALAALARRERDPLRGVGGGRASPRWRSRTRSPRSRRRTRCSSASTPRSPPRGGLAAAAAALFMVSRAALRIDARPPRSSRPRAAVTLLYLASVEVVTLAGPAHTGQTLLSVLWALGGRRRADPRARDRRPRSCARPRSPCSA